MNRRQIPHWIGYVAGGLLLAHAALSFYWVVGGTAGLNLLADSIQEMAAARETGFVAMIWGVVVLKIIVALLGISLAREVTLPVPRWMVLLVAWGTGVVLTLYALLQFVSLTFGGLVLNDGDELPTGFWAYLTLWAPLWLATGFTFLLTAWRLTNLRQGQTQ